MGDEDYREDVMVWPTMKELLACAEATLVDFGRPVGKSTIQYGSDIPVMELGEECDGFLWVRLTDAYPSTQFPNPDQFPTPPGQRIVMAFQLEVAVARCVSVAGTVEENGTLFSNGEPLPPEVIFEDARAQMADMAALRKAICSCLKGQQFVLGNNQSAVPTGLTNYTGWAVTVLWDPDAD